METLENILKISITLEVLTPGQCDKYTSKTTFLQEWKQGLILEPGDYQNGHNCTIACLTIVLVRFNGIPQ